MIARRLITYLGVLVLAALFAAPLAMATNSANIIEPQNTPGTATDGWQSANCTSDAPVKCSPATPELYFTPAGGHPQIGYTQYIIQHNVVAPGVVEPLKAPKADRTIKTLHVELPPGLTVNPLATERCTLAEFQNKEGGEHKPLCKPGTITGYEEATLVTNNGTEGVPGLIPLGSPEGVRVNPIEGFTKVPVYALVPAYGEPALNAFLIAGKKEVFLETDVAWQSDFHESFTIKMPENAPQPEPPFSTLISRQVSFGKAGNGTYITNPTTCYDPENPPYPNVYAAIFKAESYGEEDPLFPSGTSGVPAAFPKGLTPTGCPAVPFDPAIKVAPGTAAIDSPAAASVDTTLPFLTGGETLSESHLRNAKVVLPVGMGLNPAATSGNLVACTDAQFKQKGSRAPVECPAASKIGTVAIETPPLPAGSLKGNIYLGQQLSRDPASGEEFRFFIDAEAPEQGISVRLLGKTKANPITGQLTTELNENPQTPFTSVKLTFDGPNNVLTSPSVCAPAQTTSVLEPWSTPASTKTPASSFTLTSDPGGGSCPTTLGARKFAPAYSAVSDGNEAGGFSPFRIHIGRSDGQQELKDINVTLPKGLTGKLAGIPYCPDAALVAATGTSGKAELASSSCPAESLIGTTSTESGSGAHPVKLAGKAFLAGPYKGAPVSLAIVTPAVSGPFDLGTVVVRAALNVDPVTAQINAVSDAIPDVFGGVKLDIRSIDVNMDRPQFMLNPTHCGKQVLTTGLINGGGADPTNPAAWSAYPISTPFQAEGCRKLGFKPKLHVHLYGKTTRAKNPRIRAVLEARPGDANIARTALILPHSLFLDQSHIQQVCIRPKLAAHECPKSSIYGHAEATTPLLSKKLKGPVYLVPSNHKLPDLVADLRGQVEIQLHGVVGSKHGGLKTVFNSPDVPVSKFVLNMKGGKKSLIVNSTNTCKAKQTAVLHFRAHNSKVFKTNKLPLAISGCHSPNGKGGK